MKLSHAEPLPQAPLKRALLSVFDKTGLVDLARGLARQKVELLASGGTARALSDAGLDVIEVERFTDSPEVLGGRVKTLHPRIHAGLLAHRGDPAHVADLERHGLGTIDLVVCNLYPFAEAQSRGAGRNEMVENIDIGGPTLLRAAAKNADGGVTVLSDPADYGALLDAISESGSVPLALRRRLQAKAFRQVADYDLLIAAWAERDAGVLASDADSLLPLQLPAMHRAQPLRYGENPHQRAALYLVDGDGGGVARAQKLSGKELSYNNYLDLDGAYRAVWGGRRHTCSIVKHTNPCGLAEADTQVAAFERALAGDPVSAFGSIIAFNQPLSGEAAEAIRASKLFVECIVAPSFSDAALEQLKVRENLRLVAVPPGNPAPALHAHRIGGGLLVQEVDSGVTDPSSWTCVTKKQPESGWLDELAFAMRVVATLKSNAICLTRDLALLGAGAGQMSRVDATMQALKKAGDKARGSFLASDAFFPFDDSVRLAHEAGVVAVVQPGGSKRDNEVIATCDELGLVMLTTGRRHFRH